MSGFVSAVILALAITAPVARAETVAGVTAGALSVESSGAARYAVPIDVPPGVAGMEPDLSLVYSSGAGNGLLGLGWSLGGLSVIHRCARTLAQDGVNGGVNLNAEDRFCLDGQRLVAVSGAYGADGTEYRTEIDGFARIFSYGTAGTGPESFTVETKSRRILEYGVTADSRVEQQGGATVRFWALNRVFDPMGNIMDLVYDENTAGQTFKILRIDYAGNSAAGTTPQSQVAFVYESRPDHRSGYLGGSVLNTTERLRRIETWTDGALVREYRLTYDMSQRTGRSRLRSITECEAAGDCLRPIAFTWTWAAPGWASAPDYIPPYDTGKNATRFVDVNGDGLIDVVWKDGAASQGAHINTGSGWQSDPNYVPPYDTETDATLFVDVNGDGLVDVVWNNGAAQGAHINTGSGWQSDANYIPPHNTTNSVVRFAELNGDGLPDLLWRSGGSWGARINTGTGWQDAPGYAPPYSTAGITARVEDLNGDGLADFTYWFRDYGGGDVYGSYINNGSGWTYAPGYAVWATNYEGSHIVDVNGDGLPDNFHWFQESGSDPRLVALNTGTRFITAPYYPPFATSLAGTHVEDINGDGLPDMLVWQQKTGSSDARGAALNTGNGWASEPAYNPPTPTNNTRTRFHDVNGDGLPDFIWKTGSTSGAQLNTGAVELLSSITDSLGRVTTIDFAPLTDPGVYTKGTGAVFPEIDLQVPLYVVAEVSTDDGVGGQARETYAYEGLKLHLQGRGALGFAQMTAVDQQTGITTVTTYRQDFPFIGGVETSETRLADGTMVRSLANTWEETLLNGGLTSFPHVSASTAEGYEINDGPGNAPITATTTTTLYDDFGNPTSVVATTSGGGETFKTETVNSYTNDTLDWFLGQLDRAEATNTLPDLSAETRVAAFAYDPATGLLTREVIEPDQAAFTLTSDYTHDLFGNLLTETVSGADIATRVTTSGFSADGRFATSLTNDLNHGETRDFDHRFGTVTLLTGPNDITTTWDYDGFGRKVREARADGTETRWGYDLCVAQCPPGGVYAVSQQDFNTASGTPIGARAVEYFDLLNRSFRAETEGFDGTRIFADTEFNERGEVVATSRPYFEGTDPAEVQKATATHDVISRVLSVTQPDEGVESVTYAGLTTTSTNALNQSRTRRGNARGELVEVVDNLGTAITYSYDPFGNLEKTDAGGVVTTMDYDVRGLKTFMDDPDMGQWSYAYNVLGELTSQTDAKGQSVELFYDSLGRLTRRIEPEGTTDWTYDTAAKGLGKLHTVSAPHSAYSMIQNYDGLGRPSATTTTIDGVDYSQAMTYDGAGRPETLTYPSGFAVRNSYNARGYLLSVSEEGGATVFWEADTVNAEGQVTQETFGNGVVTSNAFDPRTGLIDAISTDLAGAVIQDLAYSFDKIGNLEQRADLRQDRQEDFNYDGLNRLTSTSLVDTAPSGGTLATTGYTYDALGNLTSKSDVGTFSYGGPGAGPHAVTGAGEDGYLYDANGNMTSLIAGGATHGPSVLGARTQTAGSFFPDVLMAGFTVPEGENR
ncbi:MAG: FG-GAP-like repeat-containing protein, partial [Kiloniellales bacterium]|nr:FG-GAP-like repeat-containing protein [Kiloniellales bacterium]